MIIGKQGSYIEKIKRETGAYVQISQKSTEHALVERCITVIGELESAKLACAKILEKICEDPQSGSCLNVSYADVQGPVANYNPTGSPYANANSQAAGPGFNGPLGPVTGNGVGSMGPATNSVGHTTGPGNGNTNGAGIVAGQANNSNVNYASNGSLNSLSPATINNFSNGPGSGSGPMNMMPIMNGIFQSTTPMQFNMSTLEQYRNFVRNFGFGDTVMNDICNATATLANCGMLNFAATFVTNFCNGMTINGNPQAPLHFGHSPLEPSLQMSGLSPGHPAHAHPHPHPHGGPPTNSGIFGDSGAPNHLGNGAAQPGGPGGMFGPVGSIGGLGSGPFQVPSGRGERGTSAAALSMSAAANDPASGMFDNFGRPSSPSAVANAGQQVSGASNNSASVSTGVFTGLGRPNSSPVVDSAQGKFF